MRNHLLLNFDMLNSLGVHFCIRPSVKISEIRSSLLKRERPRWAMLDAFAANKLQAFVDALVEWSGHAHIKAAPNEGKAEGFTRHFGEFDANAAKNAFAGLEHNATGLDVLLESTAVGAVP